MNPRFALLLIIIGSPAAMAQTPTRCPWLSTGSAATVLGGDVAVTAHSENNWEGACRFTRLTGDAAQAIDIRVSKVNSRPCPDGSSKLKALGNEAVECTHLPVHGVPSDTIAGRVRDAWFEVTVTGIPGAAREAPSNTRSSDAFGASILEQLAEQVAGNLY